jgi:hypothetical protein
MGAWTSSLWAFSCWLSLSSGVVVVVVRFKIVVGFFSLCWLVTVLVVIKPRVRRTAADSRASDAMMFPYT